MAKDGRTFPVLQSTKQTPYLLALSSLSPLHKHHICISNSSYPTPVPHTILKRIQQPWYPHHTNTQTTQTASPKKAETRTKTPPAQTGAWKKARAKPSIRQSKRSMLTTHLLIQTRIHLSQRYLHAISSNSERTSHSRVNNGRHKWWEGATLREIGTLLLVRALGEGVLENGSVRYGCGFLTVLMRFLLIGWID